MEFLIFAVAALTFGGIWILRTVRHAVRSVEHLVRAVGTLGDAIEAMGVRLNRHETEIDDVRNSQKNHSRYQHNGAGTRFSR